MKDILLYSSYFILPIFFIICVVLSWARIVLLKAIRQQKDEAYLFGGLVRLILWQPNEGVIILRNKRVKFKSDHPRGGTRFIYPMLGDEFLARVALGDRDLNWEDDKVLTRESLQAQISIVLLWSVGDLEKYIFSLKTEAVRTAEARRLETERVAQKIIKDVTDSTIRRLVSLVSLGELISDKPTSYLTTDVPQSGKALVMSQLDETLKGSIELRMERELTARLANYGIIIKRVQIQSIQLAQIVQDAVNAAKIANLNVFISEQEARSKELQLAAVARVLGKDAAALNEFLKNLQGTTLYMMPPFLQRLFGMIDQKTRDVEKPEPPLELPELDIEELIGSDGKLIDEDDDDGRKRNGKLK